MVEKKLVNVSNGVKQITLHGLLNQNSIKKRFNDILGKKAAGFMSSILSAVNTNPSLKDCEPNSIISAAAIAASLDLPINQNIGFAAIVPYSGRGSFQTMWRGLVQLAMRTGQYKTINVSEVYEGEIKSSNHITGEIDFDLSGKKSDTIIGYVAYMKLINGFEKYNYMTKADVEKHGKKYSKSYNTGQWKNDFDSMARKTVIKMLLNKWGILSIEMERALTYDQTTINDKGEPEYIDNKEVSAKPEIDMPVIDINADMKEDEKEIDL